MILYVDTGCRQSLWITCRSDTLGHRVIFSIIYFIIHKYIPMLCRVGVWCLVVRACANSVPRRSASNDRYLLSPSATEPYPTTTVPSTTSFDTLALKRHPIRKAYTSSIGYVHQVVSESDRRRRRYQTLHHYRCIKGWLHYHTTCIIQSSSCLVFTLGQSAIITLVLPRAKSRGSILVNRPPTL